MAQHPLHHGIIWKRADLNRQALEWCDVVANARVHGTTHRVPWEMLDEERPHFGKLTDRATLAPYLREDRKAARDGFVSWEASRYGVHWKWVGATVQVGERQGTAEIWAGDSASRCIPRAQQPKERFICPVSGRACPGVTTGLGKRRWRRRFPRLRWNAGRWKCTNWWREVWHDRSGTSAPAFGNPGPQAGRRSPGNTLDAAASRQLPYPEMLAELLGVEAAAPRERYLTTRTRLAHRPFQHTLEQFDFGFQSSIDERLVKELANLAFVAEATNVLLLGPPGVGKTHLALRTMENGHGAYFVRAYDLMEDLRKARAQHNLDRRMRVYLAPKVLIVKVLIVDEFGIWPYDRESATAFFTLVSARYGIPKELTSSTPSRCPSGRRGRRRPQNAKPTSTSTVPGRIQCQKCAAKNRDRMNASTLKSERITRL